MGKMLVCTTCGSQNPEGARFCAQCGTKLPEPSDATATIHFADPSTETSERLLNPVDAAAVDALPQGHAMLVVQRGPGSGSPFLLHKDVVPGAPSWWKGPWGRPAGTPTATSSSTT